MRAHEFANNLTELAQAVEYWIGLEHTPEDVQLILVHPFSQQFKTINSTVAYRVVFTNYEKFKRTGRAKIKAPDGFVAYSLRADWGGMQAREDFDYDGDMIRFKKRVIPTDVVLNFSALVKSLRAQGYRVSNVEESEIWLRATPYYTNFSVDEFVNADLSSGETINEAEGTFYHGTRRDFDFDQLSGGQSIQSFDRILGPHFSRTPDVASKFALYTPQERGRAKKNVEGARVFPVKIPGEIYQVPQPRGLVDAYAIAADAFNKVVVPNKELLGPVIDQFVQDDIDKFDLPNDKPVIDRLRNGYLDDIKHQKWSTIGRALSYIGDQDMLVALAGAYKKYLIDQGYGVLEYRNTNPRETRSMTSRKGYISLLKPQSVFSQTTK